MEKREHPGGLPAAILAVMIAATCFLLGNLYYAQPILYEIASSLNLALDDSGMIVAAGQAGYIAGLIFLAPLGDRLENRRLCAFMALAASIAAAVSAFAGSAALFLAGVFFMGFFATATQILVVFASILAGKDHAGRTLGLMAGGLFLGIALSRPFSSFIAASLGWRQVYAISASCLIVISACLFFLLPARKCANAGGSYFKILGGMFSLIIKTPYFISFTLLSACVFMGVIMFWSSAPLYLVEAVRLDQQSVTMFTMAGLLIPPVMLLVGWLLDNGWGTRIIFVALVLVCAGWLTAWLATPGFWIFFLAALLVDPGSSATTVTVQKNLLARVPAEKRGRINSLNISFNFLGGTLGAALGPWLLARYSWNWLALGEAMLTLALLIFFVIKIRKGVE